MGYQVRLLDAAIKDLERLDRPIARRVVHKIAWLAEHIHEAPLLPLRGNLRGLYKLRVGEYRVIYEILDEESIVIVHAIGHRKEIYR